VEKWEGADEGTRKALAFEPGPRPGGVDLLKVASLVKLVPQFKVVIDTKDGQGDSHRNFVLSLLNSFRVYRVGERALRWYI
jgi:hypothetical protein